MKVLVISDTHGAVNGVCNYVAQHPKMFDCIWHLGDHYKDGLIIEKKTGLEVFGVKGNCDAYAQGREDLILNVMGRKILLTHGHHYGVKYSLLRLHLKAMEVGCDLVCFGHTHVATQVLETGISFFNPGSASSPRAGGFPSVGIVTLDESGVHTSVVPLLGDLYSE